MELVPYLVPTEIYKIQRFAKGLSAGFGPMVKLATTLEAVIQVPKSLEDIAKRKVIDQVEVEKKMKNEETSKSNKKSRFSIPRLNDAKPRRNKEAMWCEKCRKKHFIHCNEVVTCYKYGRNCHYSKDCMFNNKICYECGGSGHISNDYPRKEEVTRALQETLRAVKEETMSLYGVSKRKVLI